MLLAVIAAHEWLDSDVRVSAGLASVFGTFKDKTGAI